MKVRDIIYYTILRNIRDYKLIIIFIVAPILIIYILGTALQSYFSNEYLPKNTIGYINSSESTLTHAFEGFLDELNVHGIEVKKIDNLQYGNEMLDNEDIQAYLYVEEINGISNIQIITHSDMPILYGLVETFATGFKAAKATINLRQDPSLLKSNREISHIGTIQSINTPNAIDYYSIQSLLQLLLMGALLGFAIVNNDRTSNVYIRINSSPVRKWKILFGRVIGSTLVLFACSIIVILFTKYVYHTNWDGNIAVILSALLVFIATLIGLGIIIGQLTTNTSLATMSILFLMMFFSSLVGAFAKYERSGFLIYLSPNYYTKNIIFGSIYGSSAGKMYDSIYSLLLYAAIVYIIVFLLGRRRAH